MFIRNFKKKNGTEEISVKRFLEISKNFGNLGRCLVALESATEKELIEILEKLPPISNLRYKTIELLENKFY